MSQQSFIAEPRRTMPKRGRTDHAVAVAYARRGWVGLSGKRYDTRADWEGDFRFKGVFTLAKAAIDRSGNNVT